jgi:hypothetical protein
MITSSEVLKVVTADYTVYSYLADITKEIGKDKPPTAVI